MPEITAQMVKALREKTGVGMMDCKRALAETGGDMEAAVDWLRKQGIASAAKKAGRVAAEGLVGIATDAAGGALVEVNAETDFVARNETFQGFVQTVAETALKSGGDGIDALADARLAEGGTIAEKLTELVATIGENMALRREDVLRVEPGVVASYMHNAVTPNLGKIGVLVALESAGDTDKLLAFGRQLAMHVAASSPQAVTVEALDPADLAREREVLAGQARASGKPDEIIEKMVEGRLRKFYEEVVLLEQTFVIDGETKVAKAVAAAEKDVGAPIRVAGFVRFALGEGLERKDSDFAAEVAAQLGD
ncbi:MAG: elongation factor Ts [Alphaproteobacteria bacterium]|nr:elongation factor Ts [Alphaproteobacteria bacterium]